MWKEIRPTGKSVVVLTPDSMMYSGSAPYRTRVMRCEAPGKNSSPRSCGNGQGSVVSIPHTAHSASCRAVEITPVSAFSVHPLVKNPSAVTNQEKSSSA